MEKVFKFRIYPNKTQQVLLQKTFGCTRYIYNYFLAKRIELYKQDKSSMSYNQCSKELTVLKQKLTWLKEPDKDALQKSLKDLDVAYKNFLLVPKLAFQNLRASTVGTSPIAQATRMETLSSWERRFSFPSWARSRQRTNERSLKAGFSMRQFL